MNPLEPFISKLNNNVPLKFFCISESSKKNKSTKNSKVISSIIFKTEMYFIGNFYKPISKII